MKIKSIVLTAALATAFSAFSDSVSDSVNVDWFTTNATSVASFDRNINNPVVVTNSFSAPSWTSIAGYSITAYVTNLVVFASEPVTPGKFDNKYAKGSLHARTDGWYALSNNTTWVKFDNSAPSDNSAHALKMEFMTGPKVRYAIDNGGFSDWFDTTGSFERPNFYAFAGMGGCTNIVGEIVVAVESTTATPVPGGRILVPTDGAAYADARERPNEAADNGLKNWVNYVLGIDAPTATSKPYAAPVQNSDTDKLTFRLAGIGTVRGQDISGATVTYTVEESTSTNFPGGTDDGDYVGPGETVDVTLDSTDVKYYRIKIKIDPAH